MNGKQSRYDSAGPESRRHFSQGQKQQYDRGSMEQDTCQMVAASMQSIELAVQHVRNPRERVPVARISVRERPLDPLRSKPFNHFGILVDVILVIEINEPKSKCLRENNQYGRHQQNAGDNCGVSLLFNSTSGRRSALSVLCLSLFHFTAIAPAYRGRLRNRVVSGALGGTAQLPLVFAPETPVHSPGCNAPRRSLA